MADRTQAAQDILLNSHEDRLDGLNGFYVPRDEAKINALIDYFTELRKQLARRGITVPAPPAKIPPA